MTSNRGSVRHDVVRILLRQRQWRLAVTVLLMPKGWALTAIRSYDFRRYEVKR